MDSNLLWQGVELMFVGMGTVFVFLTLLVGATSLMSRLVLRWQPQVSVPVQRPREEEAEIAAIAAAIAQHRRRR